MPSSARVRLLLATLAALTVLALGAWPAHARGGVWMPVELRVGLWRRPPRLPRISLRVIAEPRLDFENGVQQLFVRVGPALEPFSWLYLAVHGTMAVDRLPEGGYTQEARLEIEPTFQGRLWRFTLSDRNRIELRVRDPLSRVRYRNLLRVNYAPESWRVIPFIWNEWLFDMRDGFNQNRLAAGVGFMLQPHVRVDVGYLYRAGKVTPEGPWAHDHYIWISLFYGVAAEGKK